MQASLYQFLPNAKYIVEKMLAAARIKVIISEPVKNLTSSNNHFVAQMSHWLTIPRSSTKAYSGVRFNEHSSLQFFKIFKEFERYYFIPGEREVIGNI